MSASRIQLSIPGNRTFKFNGKGPYLCRDDITISTCMACVFLKSKGQFYLAALKDYVPYTDLIMNPAAIKTDNLDMAKVRVMDLANLNSDYNTDLCLNGRYCITFSSAKLCPNSELQFWRMTHTDDLPFHVMNVRFEKLADFQLDADHEVIDHINPEELQRSLQKDQATRILRIQACSDVEFGKVKHTACHDILLYTENSIASSNNYMNRFHLNATAQELTANPFQNGKLQHTTIRLKSHDGCVFMVKSETFAANITKCKFYSDNLYITRGDDPMSKLDDFTWWKGAAQKNYLQYTTMAKIESYKPKSDCDFFATALNELKYKEVLFFPKAYQLAVRIGDLNLITDLIAIADAKSDDTIKKAWLSALKFAIKCGNLEIVQHLVANAKVDLMADDAAIMKAVKYGQLDVLKYFITQGVAKFTKDFDEYIELAEKHGYPDMAKYLSQMPQNIEWQKQQLLADIAKLNNRIQKFCEQMKQ